MATPFWQLTTNFIDGITRYLGAEISRFHSITERQITGTLQLLGTGVVKVPDATSMQVSAGALLTVNVAPGMVIARLAAYGPCVLTQGALVNLPIPASSTRYLFAVIERTLANDSLATGKPLFVLSEAQTLDGGVLLAQITSGAATITTVTDRRGFLALGVSATGSPTGGAGGVLSGQFPNPGFAVDMATQSELDAAILTRAPLNSAQLTGAPTAPTPATGDASTKIATTDFVASRVAWLISTAPAHLDTLNELAAALNNDANFATSVFTALAGKAAIDDARLRDDYLEIDLGAAPATLVLDAAQSRARELVLRGTMARDVTLQFPAAPRIWIISDESTRGDWKIYAQKMGGAATEITAKVAKFRSS